MEQVEVRDGEFWTVPSEPQKIERSVIEGWRDEADARAQEEDANLAQAQESKVREAASQDATIVSHQAAKDAALADSAAAQALLDEVPEE